MVEEYFFNGDYEELLEKLMSSIKGTTISEYKVENIKEEIQEYIKRNKDFDLYALETVNNYNLERTSNGNINTVLTSLFAVYMTIYSGIISKLVNPKIDSPAWLAEVIVNGIMLIVLLIYITHSPKKDRLKHKKSIIIKISIENLLRSKN